MRIIRLKIGKPDLTQDAAERTLFSISEEFREPIGFKNLRDFEIEFAPDLFSTILIGRNGSGKSNLIEALVLIFRDLDLNAKPLFAYEIVYQCRGNTIKVIADPSRTSGNYDIKVNDKKVSSKTFKDNKSKYFPQHVFAYYSGPSNRLELHFDKHQKDFYDALLRGEEYPLRPLFYARMVHSFFVLMAYFSFDDDEGSRALLREYLGIEELESILFVIKEPSWKNGQERRIKEGGDPRFWGAKGVVKRFLNDLYEDSLAPIYITEKVDQAFNKNPISEECRYLFVKSRESLRTLAGKYKNNVNFFKMLESTYISDLIREVRIKVKKVDINGNLTFKELSEGEQQLLTVLGLLKFTSESESLFLLDEPDTHLNPQWKYDFLSLIEQCVGAQTGSHLIIATHDPLLIGGLVKEQVRIFKNEDGKVIVNEPDESPRGMGFDGVLKSDLFGLTTTLDAQTQEMLNARDELYAKSMDKGEGLSEEEEIKMRILSDELSELGFTFTFRNPMYEYFLKEMVRKQQFKRPNLTEEEIQKQDEIANKILEKILAKENMTDDSYID